uniref:Uncharacterized protein n=1 Tax=Nelumbo nucifera TaxID=4432 RepID=A0A822Y059_NELNU|nr:TPA_asm: hypothetical protein HUJ06_028762 [Nelumbo nucifera]
MVDTSNYNKKIVPLIINPEKQEHFFRENWSSTIPSC